jgi:hypothetical protein
VEGHLPELAPWTDFYVMTGSSAAALTGLMFVVMSLVNDTDGSRRSREGTDTFSTPTVVHLSAALLLSALGLVPWHTITYLAAITGIISVAGMIYMVRIAIRIRRIETYDADPEDWIWHAGVPIVAYAVSFCGSLGLYEHVASSLYAFAASVVLLVATGIHNAWDIVIYIATVPPGQEKQETAPSEER